MINTGEGPGIGGGLSRKSPESQDINTLDVDDLDASIGKVTANGGTIVAPKHAIPGIGWFAIFQDTSGNSFGMMQEDPSAQ
jgi:predicted enzyme related to lactoylglutathione lyase